MPPADEPLVGLAADADAQAAPSSRGPSSADGGAPREPEPYDAGPAGGALGAVTDSALEDVLRAAAVHADPEPERDAASEPTDELGSSALTGTPETRFDSELLGEPAPRESVRSAPASGAWPELRPRARDRTPARRRVDSAREVAQDAMPTEEMPANPGLHEVGAAASPGPSQGEPTEATHSARDDEELAGLDNEALSDPDEAASPAPSGAAPESPLAEPDDEASADGPPVLARRKHDELWWAAAAAALILFAWLAARCS